MNSPLPAATPSFRRVPAGQALAWWGEGWRSFLRAPLPWVGLAVALLVILAILHMLPLGGLLGNWLSLPLFALGAVFASMLQRRANAQRQITPPGMPPQLQQDGALSESTRAWSARIGPLLLASLLVLAIGGAFMLVVVLLFGGLWGVGLGTMGALSHMAEGGRGMMAGLGAMAGGLFTLLFIGLIGLFLLSVAFWFVNTLVALGGVQPWDAVVLSFKAGFANIGALLLFTIVLLPVGMAAMIPMGLGLLVLLPVLSGASYASYQDVFGDARPAASAQPLPPPAALG